MLDRPTEDKYSREAKAVPRLSKSFLNVINIDNIYAVATDIIYIGAEGNASCLSAPKRESEFSVTLRNPVLQDNKEAFGILCSGIIPSHVLND
jgi:hypothetical protein